MKIVNFGGNVSFSPRHYYSPNNEKEVLDILNKHAKGKIRVMASGHSWSDVARSDDVTIDMDNINQVEIERKANGDVWATVGAGCVLQDLLNTLHRETNHTLPTIGGIKKQTISGIISTGTHGSGRPSVSHYMSEIRVAAYDPKTEKAEIYTYTSGEKLRAARCALGCMGVVLSVKFQCVPKYYVAQSIEKADSFEQVLANKKKYELQQFVLVPYCWRYFVWTRRIVDNVPKGIEKLSAYWIRIYNLLGTDIMLHLALKMVIALSSSRKGKSAAIQWFFGKFLPMIIERKHLVNDFSENAITLHHDLFQHLEMELFVPERNIKKAMRMVKYITMVFAGTENKVPLELEEELKRIGKFDELMEHRGFFTHHYPIYCRQIKGDDTLISMTAGAKEWYFSISLFTYLSPDKREHFYEFATFVAQIVVKLYDARLHWGKYFPLRHEDIKHLYPNLEHFREICRKVDPNGVFKNDYTKRVLGF